MHKHWLRPILSILIVTITIALAAYFFVEQPAIGRELSEASVITLGLVLGLYLVFMATLGLINAASVKLCKGHVPSGEMLLLTAYSSIINFFGPLQSGPAFRALYLKKKHSISVKSYAAASLLYYFFYALLSGLFLLSGILHWWTIPLGIAGLITGYAALKLKVGPLKRLGGVQLAAIGSMALATALQVAALVAIFYVALHSVNASVTIGQAIIYTGAANLALFVSITPGAIGFRESFVLIAQRLHNIDTPTIISASLIDRGVYVAMLLILAVAIFFGQSGRQFRSFKRS